MNMREEADSLSLQDAIKLVIVRSGLEAHYNAEKDGEDRIANMREMMSVAAGYIANEGLPDSMPAFRPADEGGQTPLQGFLTQATLEAGDKNEQGDVDAVQLMTVHAAKGLEFRRSSSPVSKKDSSRTSPPSRTSGVQASPKNAA